jgi:hypothetical protein
MYSSSTGMQTEANVFKTVSGTLLAHPIGMPHDGKPPFPMFKPAVLNFGLGVQINKSHVQLVLMLIFRRGHR